MGQQVRRGRTAPPWYTRRKGTPRNNRKAEEAQLCLVLSLDQRNLRGGGEEEQAESRSAEPRAETQALSACCLKRFFSHQRPR